MAKVRTFNIRSSRSFEGIINKMGISMKNPANRIPRTLKLQGATIGETYLSIDGIVQSKHATGGGLIKTSSGEHISNFYSYYGNGTNNLGGD